MGARARQQPPGRATTANEGRAVLPPAAARTHHSCQAASGALARSLGFNGGAAVSAARRRRGKQKQMQQQGQRSAAVAGWRGRWRRGG